MKKQTLIFGLIFAFFLSMVPEMASASEDYRRPRRVIKKRAAKHVVKRHRVLKVKKAFVVMDINNDGRISRREIQKPLIVNFNKIDNNNDGFITKRELRRAPKSYRYIIL